MQASFVINQTRYSVNLDQALDISIPLNFYGAQPNTYNVPKAKAYQEGSFVGDTRQGGGCNFEQYQLITHCVGTHTECIGHITDERLSINEYLKDIFIPATIISIEPEQAFSTNDNYIPDKNETDLLITKKILENALNKSNPNFLSALIIRTLPNDDSKKSRQYMNQQPPFLSIEAIQFINDLGIKHLILDIPSLDRTMDDGKLTCHHIFWNVAQGKHKKDDNSAVNKTITEMAFINNNITDGNYFLNIQIPNFVADAAPSRLFLFELT